MGATRRAFPIEKWPAEAAADTRSGAAVPRSLTETPRAPVLRMMPLLGPTQPRRFVREAAWDPGAASCVTPGLAELRMMPLLGPTQPRRFVRVPTHAVGAHPEQREYPRATLKLPLRLRSVGGVPEEHPITLVTRDISSTGVYFLSPKKLAAGTFVELEVILVSKPMGLGNVVLVSMARVRRIEPAAMPGW